MRRAHLGLLGLILAVGCGGEGGPHGERNLLIISIDTLRRDAVGFMGAEPSPTPTLDALARESVVYLDAYSVAPLTLPAHTSLLTGLYPASHGVRDNGSMRVPEQVRTLAERLTDRGYRSLASVAAFVLDPCFGLDQGFESYAAPPRTAGGVEVNVPHIRARAAIDHLLAGIDDLEGDSPWFAWLHLYDPHAPYDAPGATPGASANVAYAQEIRYADMELGRLFTVLRDRGLWDDLAVVLVSDHGEGLDDGPERTHGYFVHDATMRVPLTIRHPDLEAREVGGLVSLIDVAPTLLALLRVPFDPQDFDGVDLSTALASGSPPPDRTLLFECYKPWIANGWAPFEGGVRGTWKAIRSNERELYDRVADPGERDNRAGDGRGETLFAEIEGRMTELAGRYEREVVTLDSGEIDALEALGYIGGGTALGLEERPPFDALPDTYTKHALIERMDSLGVALAQGDFRTAAEELRALSKLDPQNPLFLERLGEILLYQSEANVDEAEATLKRAYELRPGRLRVHLGLANCARVRGDAAGLERALRAALALDPGHPTVLYNLSFALVQKGDRAEALGDMRAAYSESLSLLRRLLEQSREGDPNRGGFQQALVSLERKIKLTGGGLGETQD